MLRLQVRTSSRMLGAFLNEDYPTHRQRDVAELSRTVDAAATDAHNKVLGGVLSLIASGLSIVMALALVIAVMRFPPLPRSPTSGSPCFADATGAQPSQPAYAGHDALVSARLKSLALIDAMHGFREVRTHGAVAHFVEAFDEANRAQGLASRRAELLLPDAPLPPRGGRNGRHRPSSRWSRCPASRRRRWPRSASSLRRR